MEKTINSTVCGGKRLQKKIKPLKRCKNSHCAIDFFLAMSLVSSPKGGRKNLNPLSYA